MDKLDDNGKIFADNGKKRGKGRFSRIAEAFKQRANEKSSDKFALLCDLTLFAVGFILSRCHLLFGARPLGLAFVCALPSGVWSALGGVALGGFTLGPDGVVFAVASVIAVFLRGAIANREKGERVFSERLSLRMAVSLLCGFVTAVYEILMYGFGDLSLLFSISMIILPPALVFVLSGAFSAGLTPEELLKGDGPLLIGEGDERKKHDLIFFHISSLALIFFIGLSLGSVSFFGISASYIFTSFVTLLTAKRFGALRGLAVGFIGSLGISGAYAVSFALLGLFSGVMFSFGTGYALVAGGAALSLWSAYYAGLGGFLTTLPEFVMAASFAYPLLGRLSEAKQKEEVTEDKTAEDMVGTMALSYQNKFSGSLDSLESALESLSGIIKGYSAAPPLSFEECRDVVVDVAESICADCAGQNLCSSECIRPSITNADSLAKKLLRGERIKASDVNTDTEFCAMAGIVAGSINREILNIEQRRRRGSEGCAEEYMLISRLVCEARYRDGRECAVDGSFNEVLRQLMEGVGFSSGVARVFGERRRHLILAGEDPEGKKITSPELRLGLEEALGVKLCKPQYFRRGKTVLMECDIRRQFSVKCAHASRRGRVEEVSGDTAVCFESADDRFYSLISDGMGSGEAAKETSGFVADYLRCALDSGASKDTVLHLVNHIIRSRESECSATVDLFELDLLCGEAFFIKSGAASSYVKRESSIFRIRSRTAPIGLLKTIDSEKIRVQIMDGDYVIMVSDGVAESSDDAPWLLELLSREPRENLAEYAEEIILCAIENAGVRDDMSVTVIKVSCA